MIVNMVTPQTTVGMTMPPIQSIYYLPAADENV
jgi:hypothetical protein